jgi:CheY-like chemotaxis protein
MTSSEISPQIKERFDQELKSALNGLYDPSILRESPLLAWLGVASQRDGVAALRKILLDAIESLRPNEKIPLQSKTWRVYQILRRRYTEQRIQREVAEDLNLSIRQMQREEKVAREMLADHLIKTFPVALPAALETEGDPQPQVETALVEKVGVGQESASPLETLKGTIPVEVVDVADLIADAIQTLQPVLGEYGVGVRKEINPVQIPVRAPLLRQALLNLINVAAESAPGGEITIAVSTSPGQVSILIQALLAGQQQGGTADSGGDDSLEMASQLVQLCGGLIEVRSEGFSELSQPNTPGSHLEDEETGVQAPVRLRFGARLLLPSAETLTVLVVEDNIDTLHLFQRYLGDSRYQMISALTAREALARIEELIPHIIILDVMMPDTDGWTLLGQLRVHPRSQGIPVIVCSIIPQERLAISLGASAFMHKPVNRTELLAALDRLVARQS